MKIGNPYDNNIGEDWWSHYDSKDILSYHEIKLVKIAFKTQNTIYEIIPLSLTPSKFDFYITQ